MAKTYLYRANENWYMRVVRQSDGYVYNAITCAFASDTSWGASVIALSFNLVTGGYPIDLPSAVVNGDFDLLFYNAASPSSSDVCQYGEPYVDLGRPDQSDYRTDYA